MKRIIYAVLDRCLLQLTTRRNNAQVARWKDDLGSVDATTRLEYPIKFSNPDRIHVGAHTQLSWGSWFCAVVEYFEDRYDPEIRVGTNCYLGNNAHIVATKRVVIGDDVMLADRVYVSDNLHEYRDVSRSIMKNGLICCGEVHIGDASWIGDNACIIGDIRIGRHCVVGANAVVLRNLPDYSVAVGVPARVIKRYHPLNKRWERTEPDGAFLTDRPEIAEGEVVNKLDGEPVRHCARTTIKGRKQNSEPSSLKD